jgi:hypothetical protein
MIPHGVALNRYPAAGQVHPDTLGSEQFWAAPLHQLYAQMPYPGLFNGLELNIWHDLNPVIMAAPSPTLLDYDPATPGAQRAVGLHWPTLKRIDLLVSDTWTPDKARNVLAHEFGHRYQHACGLSLYTPETTHARRALRLWWDSNRPRQGHNTAEDWAEVYRAVCGCDNTRGTYSNGAPAGLSLQMRSFIRGAYYFSHVSPVLADFSVGDFFIQWRQEIGWFSSEWRYLNTNNFTLYAWRNNQWLQI